MNQFAAKTHTVRAILSQSVALGAVGRDHVWGRPQVETLLRDLTLAYRPRVGLAGEKFYFLGTIVTRPAGRGAVELVDGRQRLVTLSLLLVALRRQLADARKSLADSLFLMRETRLTQSHFDCVFTDGAHGRLLIELDRFGEVRTEVDGDLQRAGAARFAQISAWLRAEFPDDLATFAKWLLERVVLAEVRLGVGYDGEALYETANARATQADALSRFAAFLAARAEPDFARRGQLEMAFEAALAPVRRLGPLAGEDFLKTWAAARTVSLAPAKALPAPKAKAALAETTLGEIDRDGPFWIIRNAAYPGLGLDEGDAFLRGGVLEGFASAYARIRQARQVWDPGLSGLYFVGRLGLHLDRCDDILLLASVPADGSSLGALPAAAQFIENVVARTVWREGPRPKPTTLERLKRSFAELAGHIRDQAPAEVAKILAAAQGALDLELDRMIEPKLQGPGAPGARHALLARLTARLDACAGWGDTYGRYEQGMVAMGLLPSQPSEASALNGHTLKKAKHYARARDRFCAHVLMDAGDARFLAERTWREKRDALAQIEPNLLVRSVFGPDRLPPLLADFGFRNLDLLSAEALEARAESYRALAADAWSPERIGEAAARGLSARAAA